MKENARKCFFFGFVLCSLFFQSAMASDSEECPSFGPLVTKESRRVVAFSESGMISALDVQDRYKGAYHLQFITMEPSSLFLPALLHADMVFYVHTGKGTVTWVGDDGTDDSLDVERGDIYKLEQGTVFYIHSHPDPTRERLRIHAIFDTQEAFVGAYSNLSDLVRGFDDKVLQMGFRVSEEAIHTIKSVETPPSIVPFAAKNESDVAVVSTTNWEERLLKAIIGSQKPLGMIYNNKKKKKKTRAFNLLTTKHDVENCNGWSVAVTRKDFRALRGCDIGVFMVNLTKGSMMGPHWNPRGTEIAIAIHGQGMVQVVCPSHVIAAGDGDDEAIQCENARFKVKEGDVFIVPRFHPMAQISFNNDSFVFVGFSSNVKRNYPQFLAGKWSVLKSIRKEILAMSFNVGNETVEELVGSQDDGVMLECASCAEEAEKKMEEEMERKKQEEEEAKRRQEEEEAKRKEEEEEAKRRQEEEEAKRRQEEEEEEAKRRQEEEEKEAKRRQEEEEEEAKRRQEEEEKEAKRRQEEEEEEAKRRQEEEEEEAKRRQEEEEEEEEEAKRRQEEEEAKRREEEEEEAKKRQEEEEEEAKKRQEEEEEEETRRREEEEEAKRREKEKEEMEIEKKEGEENKKLLWKKMWRV